MTVQQSADFYLVTPGYGLCHQVYDSILAVPQGTVAPLASRCAKAILHVGSKFYFHVLTMCCCVIHRKRDNVEEPKRFYLVSTDTSSRQLHSMQFRHSKSFEQFQSTKVCFTVSVDIQVFTLYIGYMTLYFMLHFYQWYPSWYYLCTSSLLNAC